MKIIKNKLYRLKEKITIWLFNLLLTNYDRGLIKCGLYSYADKIHYTKSESLREDSIRCSEIAFLFKFEREDNSRDLSWPINIVDPYYDSLSQYKMISFENDQLKKKLYAISDHEWMSVVHN